MKIAICSDYFYPKIGGITTHIEGLANSLEKKGHEVIIITKKARFDDTLHGLKVIRINSIFSTSQTLDIPKINELEEILKKIKPDIIHAHHAFSPISLLSISLGRKLGIKTVLTNHSIQFMYDFDYLWAPSSYILFPYRKYINEADSIIAVSNSAKQFISYFTNKEVKVIPNGIYVSEFAQKKKEFDGRSILFVGRFVYRKGLHLLLEAMKNIRKENKEVKLTMVGTGYLYPVLKLLVEALNLQKNVIIKKSLDRNKLIKLYQRSNVFAMPSIFGESFGIVLLEAMAAKTPIVAMNHGGIKEVIIDNETGLLVKNPSPKELAEKITILLNDKKLSKKLSSHAYKKVKEYDWSKIVKKIEKVYEND